MRLHPALLAAALVTATTGLTGTAHAWVTPTGPTCSLRAVRDTGPGAPPDTYLGELRAGPLVAAGAAMTVRCTIQAGGESHTDFDSAYAEAHGAEA